MSITLKFLLPFQYFVPFVSFLHVLFLYPTIDFLLWILYSIFSLALNLFTLPKTSFTLRILVFALTSLLKPFFLEVYFISKSCVFLKLLVLFLWWKVASSLSWVLHLTDIYWTPAVYLTAWWYLLWLMLLILMFGEQYKFLVCHIKYSV